MAKKRKTRQEKIIADLRRKLEAQTLYENGARPKPLATTPATPSTTYSLPDLKPSPKIYSVNKEPRTQNLARQGASSAYSYVLSDLKKTAVLTTIAIAAQVVLYFGLMR